MSIPSPMQWIEQELDGLGRAGLRRRRRTRLGPQQVELTLEGWSGVSFASNDYLGLADDERLGRAVAQTIAAAGWGSGASPLLAGHTRLHERLESRLAEFEGAEAAVLFPSGYAANLGTVAALVGPGDTVFTDRKNHASLLDGCRLSRADVRAYPHGDWRRLDGLLARAAGRRRRLVVTDGLFSMDGDLAPLEPLAELAERHGAMLLVDEAHATGVFGPRGRGAAEHFGIPEQGLIRVGTLSKALGSIGGFVAGSRALADWLLQRARSYVFSTASPAAVAAAALVALEIVQQEPQRRVELLARAERLRGALAGQGWRLGPSASQIIPIVLGPPEAAARLSEALWDRGLYVPAIRPPTVPEGESCLRVSLTWAHTDAMVERLTEALAALRSLQPAISAGIRASLIHPA